MAFRKFIQQTGVNSGFQFRWRGRIDKNYLNRRHFYAFYIPFNELVLILKCMGRGDHRPREFDSINKIYTNICTIKIIVLVLATVKIVKTIAIDFDGFIILNCIFICSQQFLVK